MAGPGIKECPKWFMWFGPVRHCWHQDQVYPTKTHAGFVSVYNVYYTCCKCRASKMKEEYEDPRYGW